MPAAFIPVSYISPSPPTRFQSQFWPYIRKLCNASLLLLRSPIFLPLIRSAASTFLSSRCYFRKLSSLLPSPTSVPLRSFHEHPFPPCLRSRLWRKQSLTHLSLFHSSICTPQLRQVPLYPAAARLPPSLPTITSPIVYAETMFLHPIFMLNHYRSRVYFTCHITLSFTFPYQSWTCIAINSNTPGELSLITSCKTPCSNMGDCSCRYLSWNQCFAYFEFLLPTPFCCHIKLYSTLLPIYLSAFRKELCHQFEFIRSILFLWIA